MIKEDNGTLSDISWAVKATLEIKGLDGTSRFTTSNDLTIVSASSIVRWAMKSAQTTGYNGEQEAFVTLEDHMSTPTRRREVKKLTAFVYRSRASS